MPIRIIAVVLLLASCADSVAPLPDVEMNPLPEATVDQSSTVCDLGKHLCDPYDHGAAERCSTYCWIPAYCVDYTPQEVEYCWQHPGRYLHGGYCSPFGEPTWPTRCADGVTP